MGGRVGGGGETGKWRREREGDGESRERERAEQRDEPRSAFGGVRSEPKHEVAHYRQPPKIEPSFFCFFFLFCCCLPLLLLPLLLLRSKKRRLHGENFTAKGKTGVREGWGSSPGMNRGGSLRRRLSSLRGAWRWSTGYLFRKVGTSGGVLNQEPGGYLQRGGAVACSSRLAFFLSLVVE